MSERERQLAELNQAVEKLGRELALVFLTSPLGRAMLKLGEWLERRYGPTVFDSWEVVDRWWTDEPLRWHWRVIERKGFYVTQRRSEKGEWRDWSGVSR